MQQHLDLMRRILEQGTARQDRTGTGTLSIFGHQMRFDLRQGFPLVTTKKCHLKSIIHELLWFISGDTNVRYLTDRGVRIWNEWADPDGELGPIYGAQWRSWKTADGDTVDQLLTLVENLKQDPNSRRHLVVAYNPGELSKMALPPCHAFFQFYVVDGEISCQLYQRSADVFLGVPFNIASYSLLTMMLAQVCGYVAKDFVHTLGDAHIYKNHLEQVKLQLSREPRPLPQMAIRDDVRDILDFKYEDFTLHGYDPHPAISAKVAV